MKLICLKSFFIYNQSVIIKAFVIYIHPKLEFNSAVWSLCLKNFDLSKDYLRGYISRRLLLRWCVFFILKLTSLILIPNNTDIFFWPLIPSKIINGFCYFNITDCDLSYVLIGSLFILKLISNFDNTQWCSSFLI